MPMSGLERAISADSQSDAWAADIADPAVFGAGPSVFEGFASADAGAAMEALLTLEAPVELAKGVPVQDDIAALDDAVSDLTAELQIDAIVDDFAPSEGVAVHTSVTEGLLDTTLGTDMAMLTMANMPQDQDNEAAALAAASA